MRLKTLLAKLIIFEFEGYWSFPVFELVFFTAMLAILNRGIRAFVHYSGYAELNLGIYGLGILLLILVIGIVTPRSFAGSISRREVVVLLSYPVKRWVLLLSKITVNFLAFFAALSFAVLLNVPLLGMSFLEPAPYILIAIVSVQVLFLFALSMFISLMLKNEVISAFVFLLLMFGLEFNPIATSGGTFSNLTQIKSNNVMYQYLCSFFYPVKPPITVQDFGLALGFPLLVTLVLFALSFIYFQWVMQLD